MGSDNACGKHIFRVAVRIMVLVILLLAGGASAATLTVDDSGGADYMKIQDAINASSKGDTILVYSGTYYENVNVTKLLVLRGVDTGGGKPVVNAKKQGSAITINADGCIVEEFYAVNSSDGEEAGIIAKSNNNFIKNNNASNNDIGIFLASSNDNILSGNIASSNNDIGIFLASSNDNILSGNIALENTYGIGIILSGNNTLTNNKMYMNKYNFHFNMYDNFFLLNNTIYINNLVDEKPIYYLEGASDSVYNSSTNAGTFYCMNCFNVTVEGLNLNNNGYGIVFWNTTNSQIKNNNVSYSYWGIYIGFSTNNILSGNHASNNGCGIYLIASNNTLNDNFVSNNSEGIHLYVSNNNTIYNNFFNNTENLDIEHWVNNWNTTKTSGTNIIGGPYLGGNFWANPSGTGFSQTCADSNSDGICDSSYIIDSSNIDYLPLAHTPGFEAIIAGIGMILALAFRRR